MDLMTLAMAKKLSSGGGSSSSTNNQGFMLINAEIVFDNEEDVLIFDKTYEEVERAYIEGILPIVVMTDASDSIKYFYFDSRVPDVAPFNKFDNPHITFKYIDEQEMTITTLVLDPEYNNTWSVDPIGGSNQNFMFINASFDLPSSLYDSLTNVTFDKTYAEVKAAYDEGILPIVVVNRTYYYLNSVTPEGVPANPAFTFKYTEVIRVLPQGSNISIPQVQTIALTLNKSGGNSGYISAGQIKDNNSGGSSGSNIFEFEIILTQQQEEVLWNNNSMTVTSEVSYSDLLEAYDNNSILTPYITLSDNSSLYFNLIGAGSGGEADAFIFSFSSFQLGDIVALQLIFSAEDEIELGSTHVQIGDGVNY